MRRIEGEGWYLVATRGSHRQYKHPDQPGRSRSPENRPTDIAPGTLGSILKQAGLEPEGRR
ncbi:type II toxin-antitoxin system HicA family toxin [uncultured Enterovirga sp.]|uniref:type II toxin-antitoxin system HicA family toxin n=1 Tax=uncultured Enterovirga sp. TaxID=2026352 RepID=UPI0035CB6135